PAFPRPRPARAELPPQRVRPPQCGQGAVRAARFTPPTGRPPPNRAGAPPNYCLTCGSDKTLPPRNPHPPPALRTYQGHGYEAPPAAGSFDNSQLCPPGADTPPALWDVTTGQVVRPPRGHAPPRPGGKFVNCVQFNEEATPPLSGSIDPPVRCSPPRSRRPDPMQVLDPPQDGIPPLKLSAYEILSGSPPGRVRRYDLRAGQPPPDYIPPQFGGVCFTKDGQCVLPPRLDSPPRLLDKDTGELLGAPPPSPPPPPPLMGGSAGPPLPPSPLPPPTGHRSTTYRLDCPPREQDPPLGCASEDGHVYFSPPVEVPPPSSGGLWGSPPSPPPTPPSPPQGSLVLSLPVGTPPLQSFPPHPRLPCVLAATQAPPTLWPPPNFQPEGDPD
ncbi:WDR83 protein, partial [Neopipo cinnamomea]|nr:WDR83 protein [Neopipo cinnamomea]